MLHSGICNTLATVSFVLFEKLVVSFSAFFFFFFWVQHVVKEQVSSETMSSYRKEKKICLSYSVMLLNYLGHKKSYSYNSMVQTPIVFGHENSCSHNPRAVALSQWDHFKCWAVHDEGQEHFSSVILSPLSLVYSSRTSWSQSSCTVVTN